MIRRIFLSLFLSFALYSISAAWWQSVPQGFVSGGGAAPTWTFTDNPAPITSGSSTNTFTAVNLGTASADRIVVVVYTSTDTVATGCTIGGVTATKAIEESTTLSGLLIWYANVPTGATGDVVMTAGGAMNNAAISVGVLTGVTATPTATTSSTNVSPSSVTITVPSTGFAIVGQYGDSNGSWTNATQDAITTVITGTFLRLAHTGTAGSQTPSLSGGTAGHTVAAAWGP